LKLTIINALEHSEDGFNARDGEGQNVKSKGQEDSYLARLEMTEPVKRAHPYQWRDEQNGDRIGECLKEPVSILVGRV